MAPNYVPIPRIDLPDNWMPEGEVCALVPIPDDPQFLAALVGLIDQLRHSSTFARDDTKTGAATVARRWGSALNSAPIVTVDCEGEVSMFDVRQNAETPCILEKSTDGGLTWVPYADLTLCPPTVAIGSDGKTIIYWCPTCGPGGGPGWTEVPPPVEDYDPAFDDPQTPLEDYVTPGNDPACVYAANVVEGLKSIYERVDFGLLTGTLSTVVYIETLINFFAAKTLSKKAKQILDMVAGSAVYSYADWHDDYDGFDWQDMIDTLCCFFSDDGTVTQADFEEGQAAMAGKTGPVWTLTKSIINLVGTNGMNNAADYAGITVATCDCDCDPELSECWFFPDDDYNFVADPGEGIYDAVKGWIGQLNGAGTKYILDMTCSTGIPTGTIDQIRFDWAHSGGNKIMRFFVDGVLKREVLGGSAGFRTTTFPVNEAVSSVRVYLEQNTLNTDPRAYRVCFYRS